MRLTATALLPALAGANLPVASDIGHALQVTLLADTNRDGFVDENDLSDRDVWTRDKGALFLANIGDTDQRCSTKLIDPEYHWNVTDEEVLRMERYLDECNDASDEVQRNAKYLAPLRTLPISRKQLPKDATATVKVTDQRAAPQTRIFVRSPDVSDGDDEWIYVSRNRTFKMNEFVNGLELGVDARDVRRPGPEGWDGRVTIEFAIFSRGKRIATDSVAMRVAPVLTHHHLHNTQRTFVTSGPAPDGDEPVDPELSQFASEFLETSERAGIKEPTFKFQHWDRWTQDFFEAGFMSIPGPKGPKVLRVMIRSSQTQRTSGRQVFYKLRSGSVGAVQHVGLGNTIDATGNLETVPPFSHDGVSYPSGRIIMGRTEGQEPLIMEFLRAQEEQSPIIVDSDWLLVKHVDEFLQFLPAANERGWVLMVQDHIAGHQLLKTAAASNGSQVAISRPAHSNDQLNCQYNDTLEDVLAYPYLYESQIFADQKVNASIEILKRETGLRGDEIFRVPGLATNWITRDFKCWSLQVPPPCDDEWHQKCVRKENASTSFLKLQALSGPWGRAKSILDASMPPSYKRTQSQRRQQVGIDFPSECPDNFEGFPAWMKQTLALFPSSLNSVVMTDSLILAAKPWGPVIDGIDVFEEAIAAGYRKVGFNVTFQDNWFTHHLLQGEVHCGTNVWRETDVAWWLR